jgi:hypothetical protein
MKVCKKEFTVNHMWHNVAVYNLLLIYTYVQYIVHVQNVKKTKIWT